MDHPILIQRSKSASVRLHECMYIIHFPNSVSYIHANVLKIESEIKPVR